jgi:hypothetical protein
VHRHPAALGDEAEDLVRRHRRAALGELDPHVGGALDDHAGVPAAGALQPAAAAGDGDRLGEVLRGSLGAAVLLDDTAYDGLRGQVALADGGVERRDVGDLEVLGREGQRLVRHQPLQRQPLLAHQRGDLVLAVLDRLLAPLLGEPLPDLGARPR